MRSALISAATVVILGFGAAGWAQTQQPNQSPTDPGTDTTGKSGNPARVLPQDARPIIPQDTQPLPPNYDTRYPREPRVAPTPNNNPLPDPRTSQQPEDDHQEQSGM